MLNKYHGKNSETPYFKYHMQHQSLCYYLFVCLFRDLGTGVVDNAFNGYNVCVFAYGQTGSGKTYSMSGGETWKSRGIIPRTFSMLFSALTQIKAQNRNLQFNLYSSYFEIYNEQGYDLLDQKHSTIPFEKWSKINLYEDMQQNIHMKNLSVH